MNRMVGFAPSKTPYALDLSTWESGTPFTGKQGWLRRGRTGGDFVFNNAGSFTVRRESE